MRLVLAEAMDVEDAALSSEPRYRENRSRDVKLGWLHEVVVRVNILLGPFSTA